MVIVIVVLKAEEFSWKNINHINGDWCLDNDVKCRIVDYDTVGGLTMTQWEVISFWEFLRLISTRTTYTTHKQATLGKHFGPECMFPKYINFSFFEHSSILLTRSNVTIMGRNDGLDSTMNLVSCLIMIQNFFYFIYKR